MEGGALPRLPQPLLERAAAAFAGDALSKTEGSAAGDPEAGISEAISEAGDSKAGVRGKAAAASSPSYDGSEAGHDKSTLQHQV